MQTIKQPDSSQFCTVACLAMICGQSFNEMLNEYRAVAGVKKRTALPPVNLKQTLSILNSHGKMLGLCVNWHKPISLDPTATSSISVECMLHEHDALLSVSGKKDSDVYHTVVWDCSVRQIRDPLPHLPETCELKIYKLIQWMPVSDYTSLGWK